MITAASFRDQIDSGRKVAIQILEFFDRQGITVRRGDLQRIRWCAWPSKPDGGCLTALRGFDSRSLPPFPACQPPDFPEHLFRNLRLVYPNACL